MHISEQINEIYAYIQDIINDITKLLIRYRSVSLMTGTFLRHKFVRS